MPEQHLHSSYPNPMSSEPGSPVLSPHSAPRHAPHCSAPQRRRSSSFTLPRLASLHLPSKVPAWQSIRAAACSTLIVIFLWGSYSSAIAPPRYYDEFRSRRDDHEVDAARSEPVESSLVFLHLGSGSRISAPYQALSNRRFLLDARKK